MASALFAPITLRGLALKNRIVVSPMCQYNSDNGTANDWHLMHLGQFSLGAGALVMTESTHVSAEGRISLKCAGMYSDENEAAMKRVIDFCKKYGVAALGLQLGHAGRKGSTLPPALGGKPLKPEEGAWQTIAPSPLPYAPDWHVPREMTKADIARVREEFVQATRRAERIGYDLVEMHAGHGYLAHEFLSPLSNRRADEYGGSLENRMRFPLETFAAMRSAWPADKPMGVRISVTDWGGRRLGSRPVNRVREGAQEARLRLHRHLQRRARSAPTSPVRARIQRSVRRKGQEGIRSPHHVRGADHQPAPVRGHHRLGQNRFRRPRARNDVEPALRLARRRRVGRGSPVRAEIHGLPSEDAPADFSESRTGSLGQ